MQHQKFFRQWTVLVRSQGCLTKVQKICKANQFRNVKASVVFVLCVC